MFKDVDILESLMSYRNGNRSEEDELIRETRRILRQDLFAEKKILENLRQYNRSFEVADEEDLEQSAVFTLSEIRNIAVKYRLKFLESRHYQPEIPFEAVLRIKEFNARFRKDLKSFFVLSTAGAFYSKSAANTAILFVKTNYDNYCVIHAWGKRLSWARGLKYWPMRSFETLFSSILIATLLITLSLPTGLITLDSHATYWSGYRAAAFFHLLIFNLGVTAYVTFAFSKNFSSSIWNRLDNFN